MTVAQNRIPNYNLEILKDTLVEGAMSSSVDEINLSLREQFGVNRSLHSTLPYYTYTLDLFLQDAYPPLSGYKVPLSPHHAYLKPELNEEVSSEIRVRTPFLKKGDIFPFVGARFIMNTQGMTDEGVVELDIAPKDCAGTIYTIRANKRLLARNRRLMILVGLS